MNRVIVLILSSLLILGSCGVKHNNSDSNESKKSESKTDSQKDKRNNENKQNTQSQQTAQNYTQKDHSNRFNNDMPVAHDGGQNGFGYGDYLAAKEASEKARRRELQGLGGSWGVAPKQDFNLWRNQQAEIQNEHIAPDE